MDSSSESFAFSRDESTVTINTFYSNSYMDSSYTLQAIQPEEQIFYSNNYFNLLNNNLTDINVDEQTIVVYTYYSNNYYNYTGII